MSDVVEEVINARTEDEAKRVLASIWDEAVNVLYMGNAINHGHLKAMWEHNPYRSKP